MALSCRWRSSPQHQLLTHAVDERGASDASTRVAVLQDILPIPPGAVAVELADGRRVFAPPGSDPEVVRRYIAQQEESTRC
jgi:hypothetical protein